MTVALAFALGSAIYLLSVFGMYIPAIKNHVWYIPGSMLVALATAFLWAWVVQNTHDQNQLYLRGIVWDAMLIGTYSLVPLFFGIKLSPLAAIGVVVTLVGIVLIKLN